MKLIVLKLKSEDQKEEERQKLRNQKQNNHYQKYKKL